LRHRPLYGPALARQHEVALEHSRTGALVFSKYDPILDGLRQASAELLRTSPENVAFVKNTTEGIALIANGYPFQAGDQVISYVHEYPANHYPWKRLEQCGVELVVLPDRDITGNAPPGRAVAWTMRDLEERVTPRTRIVALSHVQFASGFAADLPALADFCWSRGIDLVLDAAQSLGALPIDVEKLKIAAVVASGWKWLLGPIGCGLLHTSPAFRQKLDLTMVGAESMQQATDYLDHTWNPFTSAKQFEYSTSPITLAAALECCVRELPLRYGWTRLLTRSRDCRASSSPHWIARAIAQCSRQVSNVRRSCR
jgi:selenocysteine lyase/cysteine desulfurase